MDAELNRILRDISFQTMRISRLPPLLPDRVEALKIVPLYWTMRLFYTHGFTALRPALAGLDQNICFIHTDNETLNLSCDWCSIVNGTAETARVNLQCNPQLWDEIDAGKLAAIAIWILHCPRAKPKLHSATLKTSLLALLALCRTLH